MVQFIPSGLVITRLLVPEYATAQNRDNPGLQQTETQDSLAAGTRMVQFIPSGLVITRLSVPEYATAQNRDNPGLQQTEFHEMSAADVLVVQFPAIIPCNLASNPDTLESSDFCSSPSSPVNPSTLISSLPPFS
jgi:hypothetical protein